MELHRFYKRKGWCVGPLDFPCPTTEYARELEAMVKEADKDGLTYQKMFLVGDIETKEASDDKHTALLTATTDDPDRDDEVVLPKGLNLKLFRKNPVLAWAHNYEEPPIGISKWEKLDGNKLKALAKFADRPSDWPAEAIWFPDHIYNLALAKVIKGVSIGFLQQEASSPTTKEIEERPALAGVKRVIRKSTLLEISIVPIGCNPSALIEHVKGYSAGGMYAELLKRFGIDEHEETPDLFTWETKDCLPDQIVTPEPAPIVVDATAEYLKQIRAALLVGHTKLDR